MTSAVSSQSSPTAPVKHQHISRSPWKKFTHFFKKLFSALSPQKIVSLNKWSFSWLRFHKKSELTPERQQLLDIARQRLSRGEGLVLGPKQVMNRIITPVQQTEGGVYQLASAPGKSAAINIKVYKDESLNALTGFSREFVDKLTGILYDTKVDPLVKEVQTLSKNVPEKLTELATWLIEIGDTASKPLFAKLNQNDIHKDLTDALKQLLKFLLDSSDHKALKSLLKQGITKLLPQQASLPNFEDIVDTTIDWLLQTNQTQTATLAKALEKKGIDELACATICPKVFQTAIIILVKNKIEFFSDKVNVTIQNDLPGIVKRLINFNSVKVANILSERIANLLEGLPEQEFTIMVDGIVDKLNKQTKRQAELEAEVESNALTLLKRKDVPIDVKEKIQESETKRDNFLQLFAIDPICHPDIAPILKGNLSPQDVAQVKQKMYGRIGKRLLDLILPSQQIVKNGKSETIPGIVYLLQQLEFPEELMILKDEVMRMATEILTTKETDLIKEIQESLPEIVNSVAVAVGKSVLQTALDTGMDKLFDFMLDDKEVKIIMGEQLMPLVFDEILETMSQSILLSKSYLPQISKCFADRANSSEKPEEWYREMSDRLYKMFRVVAVNFFEGFQLSEEDFFKVMRPVIANLEAVTSTIEPKPVNSSTVAVELKKFIAPENPEIAKIDPRYSKDLYVDLVKNFVFEVGGLQSFAKVFFKIEPIRKMLNPLILRPLENYRASHHKIINSLMAGLREDFLDDDTVIRDLIEKEPLKDIEKQIEKLQREGKAESASKLQELQAKAVKLRQEDSEQAIKKNRAGDIVNDQIEKIARIAYDFILFECGKQGPLSGWVASKSVRQILGPNHTTLEKTIQKCFEKVIFNKDMMANFLMLVSNIVLDTFESSAKRIAPTTIHHVVTSA